VFPDNIPFLVGPAMGLAGVAVGIWYGRASARDTLTAARRLASAASTYFARADRSYSYVKAIETPTQALDVSELRAADRSLAERMREAALGSVERMAEAVRPTGAPREWEEGEMTAIFARITAEMAAEQALTSPGEPSPWEFDAPVPAAAPPIAHAPRGLQEPPRWETRPAPKPSPQAPTRAALRRSEAAPSLPGRLRAWGGTLLGPAPTLPELKFPRPFGMPAQRTLPNDPRRLAMLDPDDTRRFRTRTVAA
jgi:hypothetical protein